jgi:hypothetical protein
VNIIFHQNFYRLKKLKKRKKEKKERGVTPAASE